MHHPNASSIDVTASFMQAALSTRGINAIVSPLWNGPQLQTLQVSLAVGVRPERVERLSGALAMAAGVDHCRISRASGYLLIEIAKPPHERQVLRARRMLEHQPPSSWQVPIGVSTIGQIVWFDLSDERNCHAVLGGTTRSGKTNLLHWLLFRLMTQNGSHHLQVLLMDPKGFELQPLAHSRPPNGSQGFIRGLRLLAEIEGIPLDDLGMDPEDAERIRMRREKRERRLGLLKTAADYYVACLHAPRGKKGLAYTQRRGWSQDVVTALGLGYSDGQLSAHLQGLGADLDLAHEVGLLGRRDDGSLYDAIPGGYLVYVHRLFDHVTYLSGRATFTDAQDRKSRNLHASRSLYWAASHRQGPLLVVEGQACAITAYQWGYDAVALCGTSLNERDVEALRGYRGVYLILDSDAQEKIGGVANRLGPLTMIVEGLPAADLNAWLTADTAPGTAEALRQRLQAARPWIEVAIERAGAAPPYQIAERLDHLAMLVARIPEGNRGQYVQQICSERHLSTKREFNELVAAREAEDGQEVQPFEIQDGCLAYYGEPLGNWSAVITHELTRDDGMNEPEITYTLEGALDSGAHLAPVEILAEEFEKMRWLGKCWGARPITYVPPGKSYLLRRGIQEVSLGQTKRERIYTFTGWTKIDGHWLYLTTQGGLSTEGLNPDVRVDLGANHLSRYALPHPPTDPRPAIEASLRFISLAPRSVTLPLWAAMYAAPLTPIKSLNAVLWIYGTTQSGKSTLSHLALTHFGATFIDGHEYYAPTDWMSTVTSLENAAFVAKDVPLIIDDYAPAHSGLSEARRMAHKAHRMVRSVGNRSARGRARVDLSERKQRPPRGLVIATAENPLIGQSIVGRMIYVPVEKDQVIKSNGPGESDLDLAQRQAMRGLYAQAMSGYVGWLAERWEQLREELPTRIQMSSRIARELFPSGQARLTDYYGLLIEAIRLALTYAQAYGAVDDVEAALEVYRFALIELLRSQSERVAGESPVVKFWTAISDLLAQEKIHFAPRLGETFVPPDRSTLIGWYDKEYVYLLTNAALTQVKAYWQGLDERFDTLTDALRRELWQQEFVAQRDERQYERVTYIRGKSNTRTLWLDADALLERTGIDPGGRGEE